MEVNIIGGKANILSQFVIEIRDKNIQKDRARFRNNIVRISELMAYEISKSLNYDKKEIETPLGIAECFSCKDEIIVASIMRAGMPMHQGLLNIFDYADNCFILAYRNYKNENNFQINFEYISSPATKDKVVILADPMLATGKSIELAYKSILEKGIPSHLHIVGIIASQFAVDYLKENLKDSNITLWVVEVDKELNDKSYIIPGLGDAGDLAFGKKDK